MTIFAGNSLTLLVLTGICISAIFLIKVYYTAVTIKEYIDQKKEEAADAIEIPSEEESAKDNKIN